MMQKRLDCRKNERKRRNWSLIGENWPVGSESLRIGVGSAAVVSLESLARNPKRLSNSTNLKWPSRRKLKSRAHQNSNRWTTSTILREMTVLAIEEWIYKDLRLMFRRRSERGRTLTWFSDRSVNTRRRLKRARKSTAKKMKTHLQLRVKGK